ncbi:hypothetical protein [Aureimonas frigidaquae]|uniref:hypothetical protein n=1 Tax=Aureimonas frigidaquae TaxID=424757 RepID=UPI000784D379|nr:hypothetical protein [Aureimonas frigidaquae]
MNLANVQRTIDLLRTLPPEGPRFEMNFFVVVGNNRGVHRMVDLPKQPTCGTSACIAGHIALAFRDELPHDGSISDAAGDFLGLTDVQRTHLFMGYFTDKRMDDITVDEAVEALEQMAGL